MGTVSDRQRARERERERNGFEKTDPNPCKLETYSRMVISD